MRPVFVIRPEPGCSASVAAGRALGLDMVAAPLFAIVPLAWPLPDPARFDGLLAGSANAFRHGGVNLARLRRLPVLAVGKATADAARKAGFMIETVGKGGLQGVLDQLGPAPRALLRLAGEEHVPLRVPPQVQVSTRICYASRALPIRPDLAARLEQGGVVLLHSAAAARHLACECGRLGLVRSQITLAALGPRILAAAGEGWQACRTAQRPDDAALLALARELCH